MVVASVKENMSFLLIKKKGEGKFVSPVEHLQALIGEPLNIIQMLNSGILFPLGLTGIDVEQVAEVADAVVTVLVQGAKQLLQALLNAMRVGRVLVQRVRIARHGVTLLLVDGGQNALSVNSWQLTFLHDIFVFHWFHQLLESVCEWNENRLRTELGKKQKMKFLTG